MSFADADLGCSILELEASAASRLSALQTGPRSWGVEDDGRQHVHGCLHDDRLPVLPDPVAELSALYDECRGRCKPVWLADWEARRAGRHRVRFTPGGDSLVFIAPSVPGLRPGDRKPCVSFSARSRGAMQHFTASIDKSQINVSRVLFVTLTYPDVYPHDPAQWKADLKAFKKRLERAFGGLAVVWKLESQKRGAPHFHLMILAPVQRVAIGHFRQWVARSWFEVAGNGDEKHLRVHLHSKTVQRCRSWGGVAHYCAKYMAKVCQFFSNEPLDPESLDQIEALDEETGEVRPVLLVGRYWGVWRRDLWPIRQCASDCSERDWFKVRRYVRRLVERRRGKMTREERREFRAIWHGKHPRSYRGFVSGDVIDKLIAWACPFYDDGIGYNEIWSFERELERGRLLEAELKYHE